MHFHWVRVVFMLTYDIFPASKWEGKCWGWWGWRFGRGGWEAAGLFPPTQGQTESSWNCLQQWWFLPLLWQWFISLILMISLQIKTLKKPQASGVAGGTKTIFVKNIAWSVDEDIMWELVKLNLVYLALPICDFLENLLAFLPPNVFLVHFCTVVFSSSEFFKDVGEITDVRLAKDENGRSKGYGHIEFVSEEEAQQVVCSYTSISHHLLMSMLYFSMVAVEDLVLSLFCVHFMIFEQCRQYWKMGKPWKGGIYSLTLLRSVEQQGMSCSAPRSFLFWSCTMQHWQAPLQHFQQFFHWIHLVVLLAGKQSLIIEFDLCDHAAVQMQEHQGQALAKLLSLRGLTEMMMKIM